MQDHKTDDHRVSFDALVRELLGLDPSAIAAMSVADDPASGAVGSGLHTFMRHVLERALTLVDMPKVVLRLHSSSSAEAADLNTLFVWALIREPRRLCGKTEAPLCDAGNLLELPHRTDPRLAALSTVELVAEARARLDVDLDTMRDAASTPNPLSICDLIRRMVRLEPEALMRPYYRPRDLADVAFEQDPEGQAAAGLTVLLLSVLHSYQVMVHRMSERLRLMTEQDAFDARRPNARSAHLTTLLAGALLAEDGRRVWVEPPRERSEEQKAFLRAAAKFAYLDGSYEAQEGLNWLADADVLFGAYVGLPFADRLMHSVAREVDPALANMPLLVAVQEAKTVADPEQGLDMIRRAAARRRHGD